MTRARKATPSSPPTLRRGLSRQLWTAGALGWMLAGCSGEGACPPSVPHAGPDGGVVRCTRSEDCPRSAGQQVCTTDPPVGLPCVRCEDTRCVTAEPCP